MVAEASQGHLTSASLPPPLEAGCCPLRQIRRRSPQRWISLPAPGSLHNSPASATTARCCRPAPNCSDVVRALRPQRYVEVPHIAEGKGPRPSATARASPGGGREGNGGGDARFGDGVPTVSPKRDDAGAVSFRTRCIGCISFCCKFGGCVPFDSGRKANHDRLSRAGGTVVRNL